MVRIAISQAAFEAIAKTLALGSIGFENATNEKGEAADLARAERGRPAQVLARARRELQRRHPAAGRFPRIGGMGGRVRLV